MTVYGAMSLVVLALLLSMIAAFKMAELMIPAAFGILASMYLLYSFPILLFAACFSYAFDTVESGQFVFPISRYYFVI